MQANQLLYAKREGEGEYSKVIFVHTQIKTCAYLSYPQELNSTEIKEQKVRNFGTIMIKASLQNGRRQMKASWFGGMLKDQKNANRSDSLRPH